VVAFGRLSQSRGGTPIDGRLAIQARRARWARQNTNCVCRRFASESFLSFVPSFFPSVIRAEAALAHASTGIGLLRLRMEHRMKSVVTVQNSGVA
jgi:hypothetical protein